MPVTFFPEVKCPLGPPLAGPVRKPGTWIYTRAYTHASVYVDLQNRTAGHVNFKGCSL